MTDEELKELLGDDALKAIQRPPAQNHEPDTLLEDIKGFFDGPRVMPPQKEAYEEAVIEPMPDADVTFPDDILQPEHHRLPDLPADDPFAETAAALSAESAQKPQRHPGVIILLTLFVLTVLGFSLFCIIWDVRNGTAAGGYRAGDVIDVTLIQHDKPEIVDTLADENGKYTVAGIAKAVMPSVVEIYTYADNTVLGTGSGIILTGDGYIATNAHVVQDASNYSVRLFDDAQTEKQYEATLVGHDSKTDLAVLKISVSGLHPAELGDSDQVQLGETVCALGNPAGLSGSITTGIISGMNRKVRAKSTNYEMDCFQTDAAISPGNSGGALVNLAGQVIGITSSKYMNSAILGGSYEGLGFAITINEALPIIKELMTQGYVSGRVRIGISFLENENAQQKALSEGVKLPKQLEGQGIQIISVSDDSDLKNTILKENDWILTMNGKKVSDYDSINEAIEGLGAGDSVHCRCARLKDDGTLDTFEIDFRLLEDQSGEY